MTQQNAALVEESAAAAESLQASRPSGCARWSARSGSTRRPHARAAAPKRARRTRTTALQPHQKMLPKGRDERTSPNPPPRGTYHGHDRPKPPTWPATKQPGRGLHAGGEFLTFRLGGEEYGIDILQVQEIRSYEQPTRIANAPAFIKGVVNLRGVIVPIVDLRVKLGCDDGRVQQLHGRDRAERRGPRGRRRGRLGVRRARARRASDQARARDEPAVDTGFITGIGSVGDRMLILMDIEG